MSYVLDYCMAFCLKYYLPTKIITIMRHGNKYPKSQCDPTQTRSPNFYLHLKWNGYQQ